MTRHCAILFHYKEGKSKTVCFQEKWRVHIYLVDMKKTKVHVQLDSYASVGHLVQVCQCYLSSYKGIYLGLPSSVSKLNDLISRP